MPNQATVHLYINNVAVNVETLNRTKAAEFRRVVLELLKPANKNCYLELDLDSNDEHGILTCTDQHDKDMCFPPEVVSRMNKYVYVPLGEFNPENRTTILISMA
jgi:hypothetical protein